MKKNKITKFKTLAQERKSIQYFAYDTILSENYFRTFNLILYWSFALINYSN